MIPRASPESGDPGTRSVFESLHHLFCNMTDVTTEVVEAEIDRQMVLESPLYFGYLYHEAQK